MFYWNERGLLLSRLVFLKENVLGLKAFNGFSESQLEDKVYNQDCMVIIKGPNGFSATCHLHYDSLKIFFQVINSHMEVLCCRNQFSSVQSLSPVWLFVTIWTAAHQASLSITNSSSLLKLMPIESVIPSNHLIFCCPLLLLSIFPSTRVFSNELVLRIR